MFALNRLCQRIPIAHDLLIRRIRILRQRVDDSVANCRDNRIKMVIENIQNVNAKRFSICEAAWHVTR